MAPTPEAMRILLLMFLLCGCTVGPDYVQPTPEPPARWYAETAAELQPVSNAQTILDPAITTQPWLTLFGDSVLDALIDEALAQGFSVRQAATRIAAARAERTAIRAGMLPSVSAGFGASRQENVFPGLPNQQDFSLFDAGFDARWELDVFGRTGRRVEAADARIEALAASQDAARLTLAAEVARTYWTLRTDERRLALTDEQISLAEEWHRLQTRRLTAGVATRQDVLVAAARIEQVRSLQAPLRSAITVARRQLELLLARQPGDLDARLARPTPSAAPVTVAAVLATPADVIAQRPDMRRAERELAAATAMKGAAMADRYPRISLGLLVGLANTSIGSLFTGPSQALLAGGQLVAPLFDGGRLRAAVDMSDAVVAEAALAYEETALTALHEVEMSLSRVMAAERQQESLARAAALARESVGIAARRYARGAADRLELVAARFEAADIDRQVVATEGEIRTSVVALCKALGVGIAPPRSVGQNL